MWRAGLAVCVVVLGAGCVPERRAAETPSERVCIAFETASGRFAGTGTGARDRGAFRRRLSAVAGDVEVSPPAIRDAHAHLLDVLADGGTSDDDVFAASKEMRAACRQAEQDGFPTAAPATTQSAQELACAEIEDALATVEAAHGSLGALDSPDDLALRETGSVTKVDLGSVTRAVDALRVLEDEPTGADVKEVLDRLDASAAQMQRLFDLETVTQEDVDAYEPPSASLADAVADAAVLRLAARSAGC